MRRRWYYIKRAIRADRPFFAAAAVLFLMAALAVGSRDWLGAAVSRYGDQYGISMARTVMKEWIPAAGRQKEKSLSLIHNSEPTRQAENPYPVFFSEKKKKTETTYSDIS